MLIKNGNEKTNLNLKYEERKLYILEELKTHGKVRVTDLSKKLKVSGVTIRSDLAQMEQEEYLERVHGGAIQSLRQYDNMNYLERLSQRKQEKMEIAKEMIKHVNDGDTIALNAGTTSYLVALELRNKKNLRIITNSISVATELSASPNIELILLGGSVNSHYSFTHGSDALEQMEKYKLNKAIISVDGIDVVAGITSFHQEEVAISLMMMKRSNTNIIVADYTKIGRESFVQIDTLESVDYFVTNEKVKRDLLEPFKDEITVICANEGLKYTQ